MRTLSRMTTPGEHRAGRFDIAELEYLAELGELVDAVRLEWARDAMRNEGSENMSDGIHHSEAEVGTGRPTHDARSLTEGGKQAHIRLDDKVYTLMITRAGKLILTK